MAHIRAGAALKKTVRFARIVLGGARWVAAQNRRARTIKIATPRARRVFRPTGLLSARFLKKFFDRSSFPEPQPVVPGFPETVPDREVVLAQIILFADLL